MKDHMIISEGKQELTIESIKKQALDVLLHEGKHAPTLLAEGTEGVAILFLPDMPEEPDAKRRYQCMKGIDLATKKEIGQLRKLFFVSEAWAGTNKQVAPVDDPTRQEILVIASLDLVTRKQRAFIFLMIRDAQGIVREITPYSGREELQDARNDILLTVVAGYVLGLKGRHEQAMFVSTVKTGQEAKKR